MMSLLLSMALCVPALAVGLALRRPATKGIDYEIVRRSAGRGAAGPRVVFVGGNPGIARYYDAAACLLAEELDADVAILGLRGFFEGRGRPWGWWMDAARWCGGRARGCFSVDAQIENAEALLKQEHARCLEEGRRLAVVGHSIGGYFMLHALARSGLSAEAATVAVQPYLQNDVSSDEFRSLRDLLERPWAPLSLIAAAAFAAALGALPRWFKRPVLRMLGQLEGMDRVHEDMTADCMVTFGNVFTMAALGRTEMRTLAADFPPELLPDVLLVCDEPRDKWSPASGPLVDAARARGVDVQVLSGVPHAFGTQPRSREVVAGRVATALRGRLK